MSCTDERKKQDGELLTYIFALLAKASLDEGTAPALHYTSKRSEDGVEDSPNKLPALGLKRGSLGGFPNLH